MEQSLLTTGAEISKWGNFITTWEGIIKLSKDYYKIGQFHTIKKRGKSYYKVTQVIYCKMGQPLMQSVTAVTAKLEKYYKVGPFYYKVWQILESGANITK